ncbi:MAG: fibronectin type III domain-containing protein [Thermodesulfobacteriota bacterium]
MFLQRLNRDNRGFTLVEILVAMAIGVAVIGAVYSLYNYFLRASTGQDRLLEIQQETRITMEKVVKEVRAAGCYYKDTPIITADTSTLEFESDSDPDPNLGPWKIKYDLDTGAKEIKRSSAAWNGTTLVYGAYGTGVDLAGNITGLTFTYYDDTGTLIPAPIQSQAKRDRIRRVGIAMTAATPYPNPATNQIDTVTHETSVSLRCMGVQQSTDKTECNLPTNIQSVDPGLCGKLNLSWTKSTSSDAAGYKVYYKAAGAAFYSGLVDVPGGATQSYTLTGLTDHEQYDIAMKCYDTSGNINAAFTTPISGISGTTDTRPDDNTAPELPTGTDSTAGDGLVTLTWTPSTSLDTGGYHVYRSDDNGSTYTEVAELDSTYSAYSDITVTNCPEDPFVYKVVSWDCAENEKSLGTQSAVYGDGSESGTDIPTSGVTSTDPFETVPPADPNSFNAVAGADRIYLSHSTPADADLDGVRILRRTDQYPSGATDPGAIGPNNVKDYDPLNPLQTYALVDTYGILLGTTYYYRAFSYDRCGNYSEGATSLATAAPCGDGVPGSKHFGPPSAPASLTTATCSTATVDWTASTGSENGNLFSPASENDVVGYYVYRGTTSGGPYTKLNTTPVTSTTYADSTVAPGTTYYYTVKALDCALKESTVSSPEVTVMPTNISWDPAITVVTSGTVSPPLKGGQHNVVKLGVQNTGNSSVTIDSATFVWANATAKLHKVTLKPFGGSTNTLWDGTDVASGNAVDFATYEPTDSLRRLSSNSGLNEFILDFRDSAGTGFADMRTENIIVTLNYTNDLDGAACNSATFTVPVTVGPTITGSVQDRPLIPTTSNVNPASITVKTGFQDASYLWTSYDVAVVNTVIPDGSNAITGATLYYNTTDKNTFSAPSTDYSASPSGWSSIDMCQVGATGTYQTAPSGSCTSNHIPNLTGKRVWYYVKMTDSNTNYDIQPEPSVGIYTYDQDSRFKMAMTVDRSGSGGEDVALTVVLKDENSQFVSGAKVMAVIVGTPAGSVETGTMVESGGSPGTYTYSATQLYHDKDIFVGLVATRSAFTPANCAISNIDKHTTQSTKSCN